jgi:glucosamine--fructose-6-phosphate aminotransferase (isomerizing)
LELAAKVREGLFPRIVLTGMGSSCHGLHPLHLRLIGHGLSPTLMETSELIHYGQALLAPGTLVVAMSQSGSSAETLRLLELNQGRATLLGITNTPDSPLANQSAAHVLTRAGAEYSVSCKTYLSALLATSWLGDLLCGAEPAGRKAELAQAPARVQRVLEGLEGRVEALQRTLLGIRGLFLVGRGPSLASAGTGALITKEAAKFFAEGMSSAAFRHGPLEMVHPGIHVLVFAGEPGTRHLNEKLLEDVLRCGGRGALFDAGSAPACLGQVMEMLEVQAYTLALAAMENVEAGAFRWATKVTTTE